jgi:glycosyltransferase involved in cell wall biosynthesis
MSNFVGPEAVVSRLVIGAFEFRNRNWGSLCVVIEVILPVLDEAAALPHVLGAFPAGFAPLMVDNGSVDGSGAVAAELGARVVVEPHRGFGSACYVGLVAATSEVVCFMDCDGSLDPAELPRVTDPVLSESLDLCLGARVPVGAGAWPWHARLANRALAAELRRRSGADLTDLGPMRAVRRKALLALDLRDRAFGWPLEMVLRAASCGWRVGEVDVSYRPRVGGRSKVSGSVVGTWRAARDMGALLR